MKHITTFDDVRALTIGKRVDKTRKEALQLTTQGSGYLQNQQYIYLVSWYSYKLTIYKLQAFMKRKIQVFCCPLKTLKQNSSGEIEYDFGPESRFESFEELPCSHQVKSQKARKRKRYVNSSPQKGTRRQRVLMSMPNPARRKQKAKPSIFE